MRLIAMLCLASAPALIVPPASAAAPPALSEAAEVRLSHISIRSVGQGPPVVLIPGLASPRAVWDSVAPQLAKDHRIILVQVNGFGGDEAGGNARAGILVGAVRELAQYLADNRIEKPAVIGHSMGGLMGMMVAKDHPQAVGRLMIVDALPFFGVLMGSGATVEGVRPIAEQMRTMIASGPPATDAPPNMSNSAAGRAKVVEWLRNSSRPVAGQALYEDATTDFRPDVPKLAGRPVTVVYAVPNAARAELTRTLYEQAYAKLPGVKFVAVEDSAHFIMLDQPDRFMAAVKSFLD